MTPETSKKITCIRALHAVACYLIIVMCLVIGVAQIAQAIDVDSTHWAQWDFALESHNNDPAVRFGIYAYRSMAVPNPEIYLQADLLFLDVIGRIPGSRSTYRGADVRNLDVFRRVQQGKAGGPSFTVRDWSPVLDSVFDQGLVSPSTSWLDRRLTSAAVLLHGPVSRLTTAEAAMLRYSQYRKFGHSPDSLFVIIDVNGIGYLAQGSKVLSVQSAGAIDDPVGISPAVVFNERDVYYPLFNRDDRERSESLRLVATMLGVAAVPALSDSDRARVAILSDQFTISTPRDRQLAQLIAMGGVDASLPGLRDAWEECLGDTSSIAILSDGMVRSAMYWADRLSTHAATLAAMITDGRFDSSAESFERAYLDLCGRRVFPSDSANLDREAGGHLWSYEMIELPLDDLVRVRTGQPSSQALAVGAILDMRGVPNLRVSFDLGQSTIRPDQHWVLLEHGRWQCNLGVWQHVSDSLSQMQRSALSLANCGIVNAWTGFQLNQIWSSADALTLLSDLSDFESMLPFVLIRVPSPPAEMRSLGQLIADLTFDKVPVSPLPWPGGDE